STTYKEYRQHFEKDRALARRFQKIDVNEPSIPDTIKILMGLKPYFEEFHKVKYSDDAIKSAVELSARHIGDRKLPDKAIDVIDESGASMMLLAPKDRKQEIDVDDVEAVVARMARIPPKSVTKNDAEMLASLTSDLKRVVFGQDRSEEHTSELQSRENLVCRLLLEKKKEIKVRYFYIFINKSIYEYNHSSL